MKEACASNIGDRWPNLLPCMDHIYSERIHGIAADVITVHPRYQHLTLVVVHKQASDHDELGLQDILQKFNFLEELRQVGSNQVGTL